MTFLQDTDVAEASAEALAVFDAARPMSIFMLRIATFYIFVEVLLVIYAGALRGAGDTVWVMFACGIMNWFVAIALYIVAYVFHLPAHYAWIAVVAVYSTAPVIFFSPLSLSVPSETITFSLAQYARWLCVGPQL